MKEITWQEPIIDVLQPNEVPKIVYFDNLSTPFGLANIYYITDTKNKIHILRMDLSKKGISANGKLSNYWNEIETVPKSKPELLDLFFSNQPASLKIFGTINQILVWQNLAKIQAGQTISYQNLAKLSLGDKGKSRAVGNMVGANPIPWFIPCHRVITSSGKLGGFSSGLDNKISMLKNENTCFELT